MLCGKSGTFTRREKAVKYLYYKIIRQVENLPWVERLLENGELTELDRATVVEFGYKIYVYEDRHIEIVYKFSGEFDGLFAKSV